jgi:hypothetical protein
MAFRICKAVEIVRDDMELVESRQTMSRLKRNPQPQQNKIDKILHKSKSKRIYVEPVLRSTASRSSRNVAACNAVPTVKMPSSIVPNNHLTSIFSRLQGS